MASAQQGMTRADSRTLVFLCSIVVTGIVAVVSWNTNQLMGHKDSFGHPAAEQVIKGLQYDVTEIKQELGNVSSMQIRQTVILEEIKRRVNGE